MCVCVCVSLWMYIILPEYNKKDNVTTGDYYTVSNAF